jgi:hypothetical protein
VLFIVYNVFKIHPDFFSLFHDFLGKFIDFFRWRVAGAVEEENELLFNVDEERYPVRAG